MVRESRPHEGSDAGAATDPAPAIEAALDQVVRRLQHVGYQMDLVLPGPAGELDVYHVQATKEEAVPVPVAHDLGRALGGRPRG